MNSSSTVAISPSSRIGFDLGNTIVATENGVKIAFPNAIEIIAKLVRACDGEGYIVSKVTPLQEMSAKRWLRQTDFYAATGISREQVYFCAERAHKAPIAQRLHLTHFIDDRPEVLSCMEDIVTHRILFQGDKEDFITYQEKLTDIYHVQSWTEIEKLLFH